MRFEPNISPDAKLKAPSTTICEFPATLFIKSQAQTSPNDPKFAKTVARPAGARTWNDTFYHNEIVTRCGPTYYFVSFIMKHACTIHRSSDRNFSCENGAFGGVSAMDLTKCHSQTSQTHLSSDLAVASGEILSSNPTKCPKIDQNLTQITITKCGDCADVTYSSTRPYWCSFWNSLSELKVSLSILAPAD